MFLCVPQRPLRATDTVWLALVLLFVVAALPRCVLLFGFLIQAPYRSISLTDNLVLPVDSGLKLGFLVCFVTLEGR